MVRSDVITTTESAKKFQKLIAETESIACIADLPTQATVHAIIIGFNSNQSAEDQLMAVKRTLRDDNHLSVASINAVAETLNFWIEREEPRVTDQMAAAVGPLTQLLTLDSKHTKDLIDLLSGVSLEVNGCAAVTIGYLATNAEMRGLIAQKGGIKPLIELLGIPSNDTLSLLLKGAVVSSLHFLAANAENRRLIVQ